MNEYAQSLEEYYFNRSSATASLGRKSLEETNNCQKELTNENKKVLAESSTIEQTVAVICSADAEESHI